MNSILSKIAAKKADAFEGIMLNEAGYLAEGTATNLFWLMGQTVFTPSLEAGILDGITRRAIIEIIHFILGGNQKVFIVNMIICDIFFIIHKTSIG